MTCCRRGAGENQSSSFLRFGARWLRYVDPSHGVLLLQITSEAFEHNIGNLRLLLRLPRLCDVLFRSSAGRLQLLQSRSDQSQRNSGHVQGVHRPFLHVHQLYGRRARQDIGRGAIEQHLGETL